MAALTIMKARFTATYKDSWLGWFEHSSDSTVTWTYERTSTCAEPHSWVVRLRVAFRRRALTTDVCSALRRLAAGPTNQLVVNRLSERGFDKGCTSPTQPWRLGIRTALWPVYRVD